MARFIISFNDGDMQVADDEWQQVADESHAVVREAKEAGVWIFGGGFHTYDPVVVTEDGFVKPGPITKSDVVLGGFSVLELPDAEAAYFWAAKIAKSCRCAQEVREFIDDPESVNAESKPKWNPMVPELLVSDFGKSLAFYQEIVGFNVMFQRTEPSFAYLDLEHAQLMIEEDHAGAWLVNSIERPRGRGVNLQLDVPNVREVHSRVLAAHLVPFREITESWYDTDEGPVGQLEFLVQDPDGYLIRVVSDII